MKPFLKSVADYIYEQFSDKLHRIAIVFPNKRARLFFNHYLQQRLDKPVFAPDYYTISELLTDLSEYTLADQMTLLFELYSVYSEVTGRKESFDEFMYFGEMILADFDDIDKYLIDAYQLYQNLHDIKDIEGYFQYLTENQIEAIQRFWNTFIPEEESEQQKEFVGLWQVLYQIYRSFNDCLDKQNLAYEGKAYKSTVVNLNIDTVRDKWDKIALVGFNALNLCEEKFFSDINNHQIGLFFWDYDEYYMKRADFHEASFFLKKYVKKYPSPPGFIFHSELINAGREINIIKVSGNVAQADVMHELLKSETISTERINNTIIALADESLLNPVLHALPGSVKELNISMGFPVSDSAVMSFINAILNLHINKRSGQKGEIKFYFKDILQIIKNNLIQSMVDHNFIENIQRSILKKNQPYLPQNFFIDSNDLFRFIFSSPQQTENILFHLQEIIKLIIPLLPKKPESNYIIEQESLFRIYTRISRVAEILETKKYNFNYKTVLIIIRRLLKGLAVPFTGEPLTGLQIMGVLETRTLDFDNVIVLSMNEGVFPKSGHAPSIIPYSLRKGFGLPTVDHQDAIFGYYFYRLLQRSENVTLVYSDISDGKNTGEPSRFIQQLKYENAFKISERQIGYHIEPSNISEIRIEKDERIRLLLNEYLNNSEKYLSPSAINSYISCRLQFYFRYIAGLSEIDEVNENIEANVFGSIVHKAMNIIYEPFEQKASADISSVLLNKKLISDAVNRAFYYEYFNPDAADNLIDIPEIEFKGQNILLREAILSYVGKILKYDNNLKQLSIKQVEKKHFKSLQLDKHHIVTIGGIIDRIDRYGGSLRIIDYKTGKTRISFSGLDELFSGDASKRNSAVFQTFIYTLVVMESNKDEKIMPGLYFIRDITNHEYDCRILMGDSHRKKTVIEDFRILAAEFEERLVQKLKELFLSVIPFDQTSDEKFCKWCTFNKICQRV